MNKSMILPSTQLCLILSMFFALVIHADFYTLQPPTYSEVITNPSSSFVRFLIQSLAVVYIDLFVITLGWAGIQMKLQDFGGFIFQCLFYTIGIYFVIVLLGYQPFSTSKILESIGLAKNMWCIKSLLFLFILLPILNQWCESTNEKLQRNVLIGFFIFQTIYAWFNMATTFFVDGYSGVSFIGLYLLGKYIKKHPKNKYFNLSSLSNFLIYTFICLFITISSFISQRIGIEYVPFRMYSYINPLVIIAAVYLLLGITKLNIRFKWLQPFAVSCFSVYLFTNNPNIMDPFFVPITKNLYNNHSGVYCILIITAFCLAIYLLITLIDQLRILTWRHVNKMLIK